MNSKGSNNSSKKREWLFPCKLCPENVSDNDDAILCDLCQTWVHIKYNHLNYIDYKSIQGCHESWYCLSCTNTLLPFGNLNIQNFPTFIGDNSTISNETKHLNNSLLLKQLPDLTLLFNQSKNAILELQHCLSILFTQMIGPLFDMFTGAMFSFSSGRFLNVCQPRMGWGTSIGIFWKWASKLTELAGNGECRLAWLYLIRNFLAYEISHFSRLSLQTGCFLPGQPALYNQLLILLVLLVPECYFCIKCWS